MSQEWKLVPVVPTKEMMLNGSACQHHDHDDLSCIQRDMRRGIWDKMIAATPAPSGGEVAVLATVDRMGALVRHGVLYSIELVDRAHVTRLTAENSRLRKEVARKTHVYQVERAKLTEERAKNDALQSELTEARELIEDALDNGEIGRDDVYEALHEFLAHQSAPAAKEGE